MIEKSVAKSGLTKAAAALKLTSQDSWKQQSAHQLWAARTVLDGAIAAGAKLTDEQRKAGYLALKHAHSGAGCNASQLNQWIERQDKVETAVESPDLKV